ncbi:MAG: cyclodeaminase/cyclohydrolase family protein [Chloroflexi bacterium]|nr:cyclodeaminase/cyclohydrolase family protein [Chloroflexota bacterium]
MDERLVDLSARDLIARLATSDPVPGGGSAAALAGAMGAALVGMVVELTTGRPAAEAHEPELTEIGVAAAQYQSELLSLADADASAYATVVAARRLPRDTDREREARKVQVDAALREAIRVPLSISRAASEVLTLAERLVPIGNRNAISDVGVAALMAVTALRGAALNVQINLPYLADGEALAVDAETELGTLLQAVDERAEAIRDAVAERLR